jgi:tetraacyldisaccharide 4'-kinase
MNPLSPLGWLYGFGATARNALYDRGLFRVRDLGARTISVGNITAGGTGKTPLVAMVAGLLADHGEKVCILTRGYGRANAGDRVLVSDSERVLADALTGGDEPVELARELLGKAIVVADRDRVAAAAWARHKFGITAFVLDDGFQHRRAKRDLDMVCIDATDPFGGGEVLPAGTLREPMRNLARADAFVVTRSDLVASVDEIVAFVHKAHPTAPVFAASNKVSHLSGLADFLGGERTPFVADRSQSVKNGFLFCGLGNPESLRKQLNGEGLLPAGFRDFPDHHAFSQGDIASLETEAAKLGAASLITTGKDAVKLAGLELKMPCYVVSSALVIDDLEAFAALVISS